ncbi:MAG: substrate-binding domain-containing protein [Bryobacteraceae bacterium]
MKRNLLLFFLPLFPFWGCGGKGPSHQPTEKYFLVCANPKIPYWQEAGAGFLAAARELGVQAEVVGPEVYDAHAEREELRRVLAKKPAGVLVSAGNAELLTPDINAAVEAGTPVVTIDADAPQSRRLFFVGTNNYEAGQMGGRLLVKLLNGKGTVVFFTIAGQKNLEERLDGYRAVLDTASGIRILAVQDMKGNPGLAFDLAQGYVEKKNVPDAFVALESLSGAEIADVLDRARIEDKIVLAMDAVQNTLEWIEKGRIAATIAQKPYTMGYYGLKALADVVLHKPASLTADFRSDPRSPLPLFIDTGTLLVDKGNVADLQR